MGHYAPRIVSPITGEEEAALSGQRYEFPDGRGQHVALARVVEAGEPGAVRLVRRGRHASRSPSFSLIAYSTVFGNPDLPERATSASSRWRPTCSTTRSARGSGRCSWSSARSACSPRRWASWTTSRGWWPTPSACGYTEGSTRWTESRLYFLTVWTMVIVGSGILLPGFDQPLVLVTISTVLGGFIMFVYSSLLVVTNRRYLPDVAQAARLPAGDHGHRDRGARRHLGHRRHRPVRAAAVRRLDRDRLPERHARGQAGGGLRRRLRRGRAVRARPRSPRR